LTLFAQARGRGHLKGIYNALQRRISRLRSSGLFVRIRRQAGPIAMRLDGPQPSAAASGEN
jgi:hypothetical protein